MSFRSNGDANILNKTIMLIKFGISVLVFDRLRLIQMKDLIFSVKNKLSQNQKYIKMKYAILLYERLNPPMKTVWVHREDYRHYSHCYYFSIENVKKTSAKEQFICFSKLVDT